MTDRINGFRVKTIREMADGMPIDDLADLVGCDPDRIAGVIGNQSCKRFRLIDLKTNTYWDFASWRRAYREAMMRHLTEYTFEGI
jgi:hypothetical protein